MDTILSRVSTVPVRTLKIAHKALGMKGDFDRLFSPKTSRYSQPSYQANWAAHLEASGVTLAEIEAALAHTPKPVAKPVPPVAPVSVAPVSVAPVEQPPEVLAPVVQLRPRKSGPVGQKTLAELFGVPGKAGKIKVEVWDDPTAPEVDPLYEPDLADVVSVAVSMNANIPVWSFGQPGTGKTEFYRWLAGKLGRPFVRVSFDAAAERYELIGGERAKAGSTCWQDGIILRAIQRPGSIILLDEVAFARPEYLSALHGLLEPNGFYTRLEDGEVVYKAESVRFAVADNTNGRGDPNFEGTRPLNRAFQSRFGTFVEFKYMDPEKESRVIAARTGCKLALAEQLVAFVGVCRSKVQTSDLDVAPGLRELMAAATLLSAGVPASVVFEQTMLNRSSNEVRETLRALWVANVDEAKLEKAC